MLTKDVFGPLGVFLFTLPTFLLAGFVAHDVVAQYGLAISDEGKLVREQLLSLEQNFLWPADDNINENWDLSAGPLLAQFKLQMLVALTLAPLILMISYVLFPLKIWPKYNRKMPNVLLKAARVYLAVGAVMFVFGITLILLGPVYGKYQSGCNTATFANCVGLNVIVLCLGGWASTYFLWGSLEFFRLHHNHTETRE